MRRRDDKWNLAEDERMVPIPTCEHCGGEIKVIYDDESCGGFDSFVCSECNRRA